MKGQFHGNRLGLHPANLKPRPPSTKTLGPQRPVSDKTQEVGTSKPKDSSAAARLKAVMRMGTLLSPTVKTSAQPPAIHLPWNKARVGPVKEGTSVKGRKTEAADFWFVKGEEEKRETQNTGRDEAKERRGKREGKGARGSIMNNGIRNAAGGEYVRPERRGELPGLLSSGRPFNLDGSMFIDGSYFQAPMEANKPSPVGQKLSESLSLISLARRLQGPARVVDEHWTDDQSWDKGERSRKMYGSLGDMSVSASVSARVDKGKRWEVGWENSDSVTEQSDSETGNDSSESPSQCSLSDRSSPTSSVTAETEINETDSGTESEDGSQDEESESEEELESESDDEGTESGRKGLGGSSRMSRSSEKIGNRGRSSRSNHSTNSPEDRNVSSSSKRSRYTASTISSSRPKTSRRLHSPRKTSDQRSEEHSDGEQEEEKNNVGSGKSSVAVQASSRTQSGVSSSTMDTPDDLSTIMEDTEEENEEKTSSHGDVDQEDEEEAGELGNESAD